VTDLPPEFDSIPARLGVTLSLDPEGRLEGVLDPDLGMCDRGVVPASALLFLADVVAGVNIDTDPEAWAFTSDASVRTPHVAPPGPVACRSTELRGGRRSATCEAPFTVDGEPWGHCFIAFSRVPRRDTDPPKPPFDASTVAARVAAPPIDVPLREAAGFRSLDRSAGVVEVELRPDLLNPAGALQGAMVAGLAEAAAEDLADHLRLLGTDRHAVTEIEVRYLAQNRVSPIATRARVIDAEGGLVRVDLVDDAGRGRLTTATLLRVRPALA